MAVCLEQGEHMAFTHSDEAIMAKFVSQAAVALTNSQLFGEILGTFSAMAAMVKA